jgi:indolepyruvate ferredoxin oxidoreductase
MAYKDEYEVARLYTSGPFRERLDQQFEGDFTLEFHLAPPLLAPRDAYTGMPKKISFGPWMFRAFALLAKLRRLRGTAFDIFGRTAERRMERQLIVDYETVLRELAAALTPDNHALAIEIARIPEQIRGFGHVKERNLRIAREREAILRAAFRSPAPAVTAAE